MVDAFRLMTGGTIDAACLACGVDRESHKAEVRSHSAIRVHPSDFRVVGHIGGGLHHAFPNHGEGFCPFNDVAVAARVLQRRGTERMDIAQYLALTSSVNVALVEAVKSRKRKNIGLSAAAEALGIQPDT